MGLGIKNQFQFQNRILNVRNRILVVKLKFRFRLCISVCASFYLGGEKGLFKMHLSLNLSRIRFMDFCPIATRGRPSIILTLTPHRLLHVTLDYISHVPLHWLDSPAVNHTHTLYYTHSDPPQTAEYSVTEWTEEACGSICKAIY